ncbi:MAG: hypothetical protein Q8L24_00180, partial [bacterium]|nr:hypothetical protein [bacterium]
GMGERRLVEKNWIYKINEVQLCYICLMEAESDSAHLIKPSLTRWEWENEDWLKRVGYIK